MNDFTQAVISAFALIARLDPELSGIVALSLRVSLTASLIALLIGAPFGAYLAVSRFRGRQAVIVLTNALLGLPPVVAGLGVFLLLSRAGPLGSAGLLFTPTGDDHRAGGAGDADRGGAGASAGLAVVGRVCRPCAYRRAVDTAQHRPDLFARPRARC